MAFNIILDALTLAMQRLESLSDLSVRLQRLEHLDSALKKPVADGIDDRRLRFFSVEARGFSGFLWFFVEGFVCTIIYPVIFGGAMNGARDDVFS